MVDNTDCYWRRVVSESKNFPKIFCVFDSEELNTCDTGQLCLAYIHKDKVDDFIRHILNEIEILQRLP